MPKDKKKGDKKDDKSVQAAITEEGEAYDMDEEKAVREKLTTGGDDSSSPAKVKFTSGGADPGKNGDAKIDIKGYSSSVAMSKEELMKYASDPFWSRLRLLLFILFWVIWFAMLIGAIAIIIVTPKCSKTSSLQWYQKTTIYQVYVRSFKDSNDDGDGDIRGLISKLDYFTDIGVETLLLSPIYPSPMRDGGYDVTDFTDIDPRFGTISDFDSLMSELKKRKMKLILDFIPNHSSINHPWFNASVHREGDYTDYYVWSDGIKDNVTQKVSPPNNWRSVFHGSAWEWNEQRQQYYLHQFLLSQPDLNLRNEKVRKEIENVLRFWLKKGVDGFRIDAASHLYEAEDLSDEPESQSERLIKSVTFYDGLDHNKTKSQPETFNIISDWRKLLNEHGADKVLLSEAYEPIEDVIRYYGSPEKRVVDLPLNFQLLQVDQRTTGQQLFELIESWIKALPAPWPKDVKPAGPWTAWVLGNHDTSRLATRVTEPFIDPITMVTFLCPRGTPVVYYGDELGIRDQRNIPTNTFNEGENTRMAYRSLMQWNSNFSAGFSDNSSTTTYLNPGADYPRYNVEAEQSDNVNVTSHLKVFKRLIKLRKQHDESVLLGETYFPLITENIFSMARFYSGKPGLLVIINFQPSTVKIEMDLKKNPYLPASGKVVLSSAVPRPTPVVGEDITFDSFDLGPRQAIIVEFNPISDE